MQFVRIDERSIQVENDCFDHYELIDCVSTIARLAEFLPGHFERSDTPVRLEPELRMERAVERHNCESGLRPGWNDAVASESRDQRVEFLTFATSKIEI